MEGPSTGPGQSWVWVWRIGGTALGAPLGLLAGVGNKWLAARLLGWDPGQFPTVGRMVAEYMGLRAVPIGVHLACWAALTTLLTGLLVVGAILDRKRWQRASPPLRLVDGLPVIVFLAAWCGEAFV